MSVKPGTPPYETLAYMPQLDALRAFAVGGVFFGHFWVTDASGDSPLKIGDWGQWGVQLFFVLSGYLITGILLKCRDHVETGYAGFRPVLLKFYGRRFLRLMPIYYLTLAVIIALTLLWNVFPGLVRNIGWYITYLQNFLLVAAGDEGTAYPCLHHFWTLAIEEQFYLLWAPVVLFVSRQWLIPVIVLLILSVMPFRFVMVALLHMDWSDARLLTPSHFDTLGLGALLAVVQISAKDGHDKASRLATWLLWPGLVLMACFVGGRAINLYVEGFPVKTGLLFLFGATASGMVFVWVIHKASRGFGGVVGIILTWAPLIYLGKISYGLYVYHLPVLYVLENEEHGLFQALGMAAPQSGWLSMLVYSGATIAVAMASWHLIERPLQRFKKYLRYQIPSEVAAAPRTTQPAGT